jgi:hypothetical protein
MNHMFTDTLKRVLADLGLADDEANCRSVIASAGGLRCSVEELPAKLAEQARWPHPHDPMRSDAELVELLEQHRHELCPLTAEEKQEWLEHVKACGGYEGTALGASTRE